MTDRRSVNPSETNPVKLSLTMGDIGSWHVHTLGAVYTFRLSDHPKTVERVPITGGPIPTSDAVQILESIEKCQVGLPGFWFMNAPRDSSAEFSEMQLWNGSSEIQSIESADPPIAS